MNLYLDESGNTGANWCDCNQPVFVYGGWLILDNNSELVTKKIKDIFRFSKAVELKSRNIIKRKRTYFYNMLEWFWRDEVALPVFCVVDKKYMISAKIVETFFDPAYNSQISNKLSYDSKTKKALASFIYSNEEILVDFAELISTGNTSLKNMRCIREKLARHFLDFGLTRVCACIDAISDDDLMEMVDEFLFISDNGTKMRKLALVEPMLANMLRNVGVIGSVFGYKIDIIVDRLIGYDDVFMETQTLCSNLRWIPKDTSIRQADSKDELLLQMADLLSGYVERCFTNIDLFKDDKDSNAVWQKFIVLRDSFVEQGIILWELYGDDSFMSNIGVLAGLSENKLFNYNCIDIIKNSF